MDLEFSTNLQVGLRVPRVSCLFFWYCVGRELRPAFRQKVVVRHARFSICWAGKSSWKTRRKLRKLRKGFC